LRVPVSIGDATKREQDHSRRGKSGDFVHVSPEIVSVIPQMGGALVQTAAPGDTIALVARTRDLNGDPLQYEWTALEGNGTVTPAAVGSATWKLPNLAGRYSAYLQVGDGDMTTTRSGG
jgi:hypothetical protein